LVLSKIQLALKTGTSSTVTLDPGETRVFSPSDPNLADFDPASNSVLSVTMQQGARTQGGYRIILKKGATGSEETLTGSPTARLTIKRMGLAYKNIYFGSSGTENLTGNALHFSAKIGGTVRNYAPVRLQFRPAVSEGYYPPITSFPEVNLDSVAASNAVFASSNLRFRTANDTRFPIKTGFNSSVTATCLEGGIGAYKGTSPHSSPIEFDVWKHSDWADTRLPNNSGYIVTGVDASNGINRCILHEISLRPPSSLGELTHLQLRGPNPYPPFRTNIIANSAAHPLCLPDQVKVPQHPWFSGYNPMQFDDSYIANRMLFDDWFLSSIAPETTDWSGATLRSIQQVYQDHVTLKKPLPNSAYLPSTKADAAQDLVAKTRYTTIASRLDVKGMFNINSTSVIAWKSLLGHSRDSDVPVLGPGGLVSSSGTGHPISRTTAAGDVSADGVGLTGYNKFAGHRRLTDEQIDALAEAIVRQIRSRGPALSLSEFVNRQLRASSDPRALAGPIQAALDELANTAGSTNPYSELQQLCLRIDSVNLAPDAQSEYGFRKAAEGWTGEGLPGWITQADILRPIAPVISARDDTFVIRTCGISYAPDGITVRAKVWSEAVIRRQPEYVAPNTGVEPSSDGNLTGANGTINKSFGRRMEIVSFRYLSPTEI
jgi:hypothetical protein